MKKNLIYGITILVLAIILGILVYLYFGSNTSILPQGMNFSGNVDLNSYTEEEYVFEEEDDDILDTSYQETINLDNEKSTINITAGGEYTLSRKLYRKYCYRYR